MAGFARVLGCIVGAHILVKAPKMQQHLFPNRKGRYSISIQAACDHVNLITQLTAKWPGSTHDSFIWRNCDLYDLFEAHETPEGWLLSK